MGINRSMSEHGTTPELLRDSLAGPRDVLQLHAAEYTMLTTRSTYWILIQSGLWPLLTLFVTFATQLHGRLPSQLLAWGSLAVVLIISIGYYATLVEQYRNILYIETQLRPLVETCARGQRFWLYEPWLATERGSAQAWFEFGPLALPASALVLASWYHLPRLWSAWDWTAALVAVGVIAGMGRIALLSARARRRWSANYATSARTHATAASDDKAPG